MAKSKVKLEYCPSCEKEHPSAIFAPVEGLGRVCAFCVAAHEQKLAEIEQQKLKAAHEARLAEIAEHRGKKDERAEIAALNRRRQKAKELAEREEIRRQKRQQMLEQNAEEEKKKLALQELAERELIRRHLLPFINRYNDKYEAGWVHKDICARLEQFSLDVAEGKSPRLMLFMPPRHGKQIADSTPILTPDGWKKHGELKVGDRVFHPSGKALNVLAVSEKTPSDYIVQFSNGEEIRCHENHEWTIFDRSDSKTKTVETNWFLRKTKFGKQLELLSGNRCKFLLPEVKAFEFDEKRYDMPPYVLGAWLGDGSRGKGCIAPQRRLGIIAVRHEPNGEVGHCIQVDSPDGLYLVGEKLIPTHNSEIASRSFPAWHLGKYPHHEFISCSYSSDLALDFSRKVREVIRTPDYQKIFPTRLNKDTQRVDKWATTEDGGYTAAGIGGPITGRGAHVLVIDDPVKNREEADSESVRRSIKDWYTSTAYTRLAPGGGVLVILTRWHDDDLAGWLLNQAAKGEGDEWEVIEYPAIATKDERYRRKGEALHEARYPLEALLRIKRTLGDRDWSALYQQQPVADEGDFFTKEMFVRYGANQMPGYDEMNYYTVWDLAIGQRESNDETFGVTVGIDRQRRLWVVDIRHGRWGSEEIVNQILDCYSAWRSDVTGIEKGHIEMAIGPYLEAQIKERGFQAMYIQGLKPGRRDKQARARPIQALMQRKQVLFRAGCDATQYLINQMLRFPSGVHDDGVDCMAYIGQLIQDMTVVPEVKRKKKGRSWKDRLRQSLHSSGAGSHMGV